MCKNGLGLFAQKWLLFLEIWWIKFLQNDKQHLLLKFFTKIFIFDWVIAIFMFFDEWWRPVLVQLKKNKTLKSNKNKEGRVRRFSLKQVFLKTALTGEYPFRNLYLIQVFSFMKKDSSARIFDKQSPGCVPQKRCS